jgi:hypothetical protein
MHIIQERWSLMDRRKNVEAKPKDGVMVTLPKDDG